MKLEEVTRAVMASGLDMVAGVVLFLSAFFLDFAGMQQLAMHNAATGMLVTILAGARVWGRYAEVGLGWTSALVGLWVAISPWALGFASRDALRTNNLVVGLVIAAFALWSVIGIHAERRMPKSNLSRLTQERLAMLRSPRVMP